MRGKMRGSKGVGLNYVAAAVGDCGDMMGFLLVLSVSVGIFFKKNDSNSTNGDYFPYADNVK